jgi:general secretion pathway protein L
MAATLVVYLGYQGSRYYALSNELAILEQQATPLFTKVFSRKPRAGSLLAQTQRLMKRSGGEAKQGEFLELLNKTTAQIQSVSVIKPTSITFDGRRSELRLDVLAPDYESLNQFKAQLTKNGLVVDMSSASAQGDKFSTRLSIRSGS